MAAVTRGAPGLLQITITQSQFHHVYTFTKTRPIYLQ